MEAAEDSRCAEEEKLFYPLPDRVVSESTYAKKPFGFQSEQSVCPTTVVSFSLFDGDDWCCYVHISVHFLY